MLRAISPRESRMREIRPSGLTRERDPSLDPLYSTRRPRTISLQVPSLAPVRQIEAMPATPSRRKSRTRTTTRTRTIGGPGQYPLYLRAIRARCASASSHKWEAYRRRRFCRFSRRERRAYLNPYVRSEQRRKSAKAPSALRVGLKRVRLRRCSFVTYRSGYAPHSRLASKPF